MFSKPVDLEQLTKRNLLAKAKKLGIKNAAKVQRAQLMDVIDQKVLKLGEIKQSAFKGFTNQFTLEPSSNVTYDSESFLTAVKRKAFAKTQTQTKVKIFLRANMEKTNLEAGESLRKNVTFDHKLKLFLKQQT